MKLVAIMLAMKILAGGAHAAVVVPNPELAKVEKPIVTAEFENTLGTTTDFIYYSDGTATIINGVYDSIE